MATSRLAAFLSSLPKLAPRMAVCSAIGIAVGWVANVMTMAGIGAARPAPEPDAVVDGPAEAVGEKVAG
mgnify:CR=1 FL=1